MSSFVSLNNSSFETRTKVTDCKKSTTKAYEKKSINSAYPSPYYKGRNIAGTYSHLHHESEFSLKQSSEAAAMTVPQKVFNSYSEASVRDGIDFEQIWIPHEELGFTPAVKLLKLENGNTQVKLDNGEILELAIKDPSPVHPSCLKGIPDLLSLGEFDMGPLLHNVRVRYFKNEIYTSVGPPILISVNPYKKISKLYSQETASKYRKENFLSFTFMPINTRTDDYYRQTSLTQLDCSTTMNDDLAPHPYRIAQAALTQLFNGESDQSVIISGESGAGKTEATKIILSYLAHVPGFLRCDSKKDNSLDKKNITINVESDITLNKMLPGIEVQITESNHLLESFGNAKTLRNDNSSRFGKFTQIVFDLKHRKLMGSRISSYLLEKSRIVMQQAGERNYHIFYQLCNTRHILDFEIQKLLSLEDAHIYKFLNSCTEVDSIDDIEDFKHLLNCLNALGFSYEIQKEIFCLLAGILHLGNVCVDNPIKNLDRQYEEQPIDENLTLENPTEFEKVCDLFGVESSELLRLLRFKNIIDPETQIKIYTRRSSAEVFSARDALCKAIYENLFLWIISKVNHRLASAFNQENESISKSKQQTIKESKKGKIGLLDIFGFEVFDLNSFEQLCINYANERLQQHFNLHVFREEQNLYKVEGINWQKIKFEDNSDILNALTNKTFGIFSTLDSECLMPKGSDETFLRKVLQSSTPIIIKPSGLKRADQFGIAHYAGPVFYSSVGLLDKNRDRVHNDIYLFFETAKSELLRQLFTINNQSSSQRRHSENTLKNNDEKKVVTRQLSFQQISPPTGFATATISYTFRKQLNHLLEILGMTTASYIRCIKPNSFKEPLLFESLEVLRQLRCAGMLESIRIRKAGYPIRIDTRAFINRYRALLDSNDLKEISKKTPVELLQKIANKLLEKYAKIQILNNANNNNNCNNNEDKISYDNNDDNVLLANWQIGITRVFMKYEVQILLEKKTMKAWNKHATTISRYWKGYKARKQYIEILHASYIMASYLELILIRTSFIKRFGMCEKAACKIQNTWKGFRQKSIWNHCIRSVRLIQIWWRKINTNRFNNDPKIKSDSSLLNRYHQEESTCLLLEKNQVPIKLDNPQITTHNTCNRIYEEQQQPHPSAYLPRHKFENHEDEISRRIQKQVKESGAVAMNLRIETAIAQKENQLKVQNRQIRQLREELRKSKTNCRDMENLLKESQQEKEELKLKLHARDIQIFKLLADWEHDTETYKILLEERNSAKRLVVYSNEYTESGQDDAVARNNINNFEESEEESLQECDKQVAIQQSLLKNIEDHKRRINQLENALEGCKSNKLHSSCKNFCSRENLRISNKTHNQENDANIRDFKKSYLNCPCNTIRNVRERNETRLQECHQNYKQNVRQSLGQNVRQSLGQNLRQSLGQKTRKNLGQTFGQNLGQDLRHNFSDMYCKESHLTSRQNCASSHNYFGEITNVPDQSEFVLDYSELNPYCNTSREYKISSPLPRAKSTDRHTRSIGTYQRYKGVVNEEFSPNP